MTVQAFLAKADAAPLEGYSDTFRFRFHALGTMNDILFRAASRARAAVFRDAALEWIRAYEARHSVFISDSMISKINAAAGAAWVDIPPETEALFRLCDWYVWMTKGLLDPTAGPLLQLWDFRASPSRVPSEAQVREALSRIGWEKVLRQDAKVFLSCPGMKLDLGGIGKEYAVDRLVQLAAENGVRDILVDLGHDIRAAGVAPDGGPWRVGLEHPQSPGRCWGEVVLDNAALCCSGNYARYFEVEGRRYSHLINPRTGYPADSGCDAAWVHAATAVEAGALSMLAVMLGPDEGLPVIQQTQAAEGCLWLDGRCHQTRRFHVQVHTVASHVA